jgi:vitamin B12 transporter
VRAGRALALTAGARVDRSDQFGSFTTARAGLSWQATSRARLHAAWGTGFKEPTFVETYATGFARGNPELAPEQSRSAELGLRIDGGFVRAAATAFRQSFRNLIQYTFAPGDAANFYNLGAARATGAEAELAAALPHGLQASAGYTWLRTEVTDAGTGEDRQFLEGEPLLRRPGHHLTAAVGWQGGSLGASLRASHTGARADLDFTNPAEWQGRRVELPSHTTLDAALAWRRGLGHGELETTLRVRNLFDERYQDVYNFPAPGRTLQLELRVAR